MNYTIDKSTGLKVQQSNSGDLAELRKHWFRPDGSMKSTLEIRADEAQEKYTKHMVAAEARARAQKTLSPDERLIQSFDSLIAERAKDAKYATTPGERSHNQQYLDHLKGKRAEVENKIAEDKRVADLASNRQVQLARTYAETYATSPPPGSDPQGVLLAQALAGRTDCDPQTLVKAFWAQVASVEATALTVTRSAASAAREAANKSEYQAAQANVTALETEQRLHQAREQA